MKVIRVVADLYRYQKPAFIGLLIIIALVVTAIFAPWMAPYGYRDRDLDRTNLGPCWAHPLGTDELGRDQLSRIIWGARTAAFVVVVTLILSTPLGIVLGAISGYFGGWVDTLIMRVADVMFAYPGFLFILFLAATIQPRIDGWARNVDFLASVVKGGYINYIVVTIALSAVGWAGTARLVRSLFLKLKKEEFVTAAKAIGATDRRIVFRHILPNALPPIIVSLSMSAGGIILTEASLSFLGIGIRPPNPSWGAMIYTGYMFWRTRPWMIWGPGGMLALAIFAFNFLGDGLNAIFNPKEIKKR